MKTPALVRTPTIHESGVREAVTHPLLRWVTTFEKPGRPAVFTIPGANPEERGVLTAAYMDPRYAPVREDDVEDIQGPQTREWLSIGAVESFVRRVEHMRLPSAVRAGMRLPEVERWELLWGLMRAEALLVEEPLRSLVDHPWNRVTEVHQAIWEARFLDRESGDKSRVHVFVDAMGRWMLGRDLSDEDKSLLSEAGVRRQVDRDEDRLDIACFLLTLAEQNGLLKRVILAFDGFEEALHPAAKPCLRQLLGVIRVTERWVGMGNSPIGLFLGTPAGEKDLAALRKLNPQLASRVVSGLRWTL